MPLQLSHTLGRHVAGERNAALAVGSISDSSSGHFRETVVSKCISNGFPTWQNKSDPCFSGSRTKHELRCPAIRDGCQRQEQPKPLIFCFLMERSCDC